MSDIEIQVMIVRDWDISDLEINIVVIRIWQNDIKT